MRFFIVAIVLAIVVSTAGLVVEPPSPRFAAAAPSVGIAGAAEETVSMVAVGDMAVCGSSDDSLVSSLLDTLPGEILGLGDYAYDNASNLLACFDPIFGRHLSRIIPAVGNHEYLGGSIDDYSTYFGAAVGPVDDYFFVVDRGNWQIIVLNSNCSSDPAIGIGCGVGSEQYRWLEATLAAAGPNICRAVITHHPRWTSYPLYADQGFLDPMIRLANVSGVDLLLSGHAHHYERFEQQSPDQIRDDDAGFRQFVVGTGGRALRPDNDTAVNSGIRIQAHGALSLELESAGYSWAFQDTDASVLDSGSDSCVNALPPDPDPDPDPVPPGEAQVFRLYRAMFLRDPDGPGVTYWLEQRANGRDLRNIAEFFAASPEFSDTYGVVSNGGFVTLIYQNVLERQPDPHGLSYWLDRLDRGLRRGEMVLFFSDSDEFVASVGV